MYHHWIRTLVGAGVVLASTRPAAGQFILQQRPAGSSLSLNPVAPPPKEDATGAVQPTKAAEQSTSTTLGFLSLSTMEKKAELNLYGYSTRGIRGRDVFAGLALSGEVKNSLSSILKSGDLVTGATATARAGVQLKTNRTPDFQAELDQAAILPTIDARRARVKEIIDQAPPAWDLWLVGNASYAGSKFKSYVAANSFAKQIQKETFSSPELGVGLNYWQARVPGINSTLLAGVTLGVKRKNNFDNLTESAYEDTQLVTDSVSKTTRKIVTKETVYTGSYEEATVFPFITDVYLVPLALQNIGLLVSQTTDFSRAKRPRTTPSFGIFFLKNSDPFLPVAGVSVGYYDIYDNDASDNEKGKRNKWTISLVTRINLLSNQKKQ